jgi:hypothetical protein
MLRKLAALVKREKKEQLPDKPQYVLQREYRAGRRRDWMEEGIYDRPITADEVAKQIEEGKMQPGRYRLDKVQGNTVTTEWVATFRREGEEPEEQEEEEPLPKMPRESTIRRLKDVLLEVKEVKDDLKELAQLLNEITNPQIDMEKAVDEYFEKAEKMARRLGYVPAATVGERDKIPVEGKIPAALVYAPKAIEDTLEAVEKRLVRWGIISQPTPQIDTGERKFIKLPPKPEGETSDSAET